MTNPNQDAFLQRIRQALERGDEAKDRQQEDRQQAFVPSHPATRSHKQKLALLDQLTAVGQSLHMNVRSCPDRESLVQAVAEIIETTCLEDQAGPSIAAWNHPLISSLDLDPMLRRKGWSLYLTTGLCSASGDPNQERQAVRERVITSGIGLTSADYCLADTATLVMLTKENQPRSVSLLPATHIALIELDQILLDLQELYQILRNHPHEGPTGLNRPYMNLISGPSKTADIEMTMVHGVHGPRTLHLLVLTPKI